MADAFEDEVEPTVTIGEYIEGMEAEELEADLVLGGDEGKECTYSSGYMKRQAIFSCLTCVSQGNAGVCTACSLTCHDGHEVVELWTKRKFRCDCGNSKFGDSTCKLCPEKDSENTENRYNHNFKGSYCKCGRPYPDPDLTEQVEMIQCCICEDWFHEDHLGLGSTDKIPRDEENEPIYEDFICQKCSPIFSYLNFYPVSIWASSKQKTVPPVENESTEKLNSNTNTLGESTSYEKNHLNIENAKCILEKDINTISSELDESKPLFLSKKWRELLCKCVTCMEYYNKNGIEYLIDKEDSIEEYEKIAKQRREEKLQQQEGAEMNFLNKLDHVQKIEILNGIADMKNEFRSFLESFDPSKPVTSEDVKSVFENLAKRKKQRFM